MGINKRQFSLGFIGTTLAVFLWLQACAARPDAVPADMKNMAIGNVDTGSLVARGNGEIYSGRPCTLHAKYSDQMPLGCEDSAGLAQTSMIIIHRTNDLKISDVQFLQYRCSKPESPLQTSIASAKWPNNFDPIPEEFTYQDTKYYQTGGRVCTPEDIANSGSEKK